MDAKNWDDRYSSTDLVWSADPNQWVVELTEPMAPGRALDLAAGEGRNAIWLVRRGWTVTAVDFSAVAVERMHRLATAELGEDAGRLTPVIGDATEPQGSEMDLVLFCYLHLPEDQWRRALSAAVEACAPGGKIVIIGHARRNLTEGVGGPQNPDILYDPEQVTDLLADLPVTIESAEIRTREVPTDAGVRVALDTIVMVRRTDTYSGERDPAT